MQNTDNPPAAIHIQHCRVEIQEEPTSDYHSQVSDAERGLRWDDSATVQLADSSQVGFVADNLIMW